MHVISTGYDSQHILSSRSMCVYRIGLGVLSTDARFIVTILKVFNTHWSAPVRTKLLHENSTAIYCAHCTANFTGSKQFVSVLPVMLDPLCCACAEGKSAAEGAATWCVFLPVDCIEYFYGNEDGQSHGHGFGVVEYLTRDSREHPGLCGTLPLVRLSCEKIPKKLSQTNL